jgi:diguanylate cyclase (GGDEF)-like protein
MGIVAFLIAVLYVCLGFAAGVWMSRRGAALAMAGASAAEPLREDEDTFNIRGDQAAEFLDRIHKLTSNVDSDVDRHATRVAAISGGLSGQQRLTVNAAEAAAAQLLEANQQLQSDLATAREEIKAQRQMLDAYMAEALTDPLTGLGNRRKFDQELARRFAQWRRVGTPLTLVLVDVDHFKRVNDEHGHVAGDAVLHDVAQVLGDCVREMDVVARYGGEEFGMILPGTTLKEAVPVAERVRGAIASRVFQYAARELRITVSAGIAEAVLINECDLLVARADMALYAAKDAGRDCCHAHDGQGCLAIEKSAPQNRRKSDSRQRIAPFVDGQFPDADMFYSVDCEELSPQGFTFLVEERPLYDSVLLALGEERDRAYTSATVKHCRNIGSDAAPMYRVSCQFTVPVDRFAEAVAS